MRMLYIMASSLALTLGLRIVDPPVASAVSSPAMVQAADIAVGPQCRNTIGQPHHRGRQSSGRDSAGADIC